MRPSCLLVSAFAMLLSVVASAQESLCSPCVDVPVNIPPEDIQRIHSPVPGGELFDSGIMSVPRPVDQGIEIFQLRIGNPGPFLIPVSLGDPASFPMPFASVFDAAAAHLRSRNHDAGTFNARLIVCPDQTCILDIYPASLGHAISRTVRECPAEYCATMTYSLRENRVLEIREWPPQERPL